MIVIGSNSINLVFNGNGEIEYELGFEYCVNLGKCLTSVFVVI